MNLLEGTDLEIGVRLGRPSLLARYERILEILPDFGLKHSSYDWMEAHVLFASRNFSYAKENKEGRHSVIVPLADLFNHKNPADLHWKFETDSNGEKAFVYEALRDIEQGEEVHITYGTKDNQNLLSTYGFIIPDNPQPRQVEVRIPKNHLKQDDKLIAAKQSLVDSRELKICKDFHSPHAASLRSKLRFFYFDDDEKV